MSSAPEEKMKLVSAFFVQSPTGLKNMYGAVQVGWAVFIIYHLSGPFCLLHGLGQLDHRCSSYEAA